MNHDEYGTILNGEDTIQEIALALATDGLALIPWTDEHGTQLDILFAWRPALCSPSSSLVQRGIRPTDLFVSIMSLGAFGFELDHDDTHAGYYGEKFRLTGDQTCRALADLINGVKRALRAEIGQI
jgi:hypothetical protein